MKRPFSWPNMVEFRPINMNVARNKGVILTKYEALQTYFGYSSFREGQEVLVDAILSGQDALGIMPTGGGKSLCYQLPATLLPGITIVVSPLISLMKDQVDALNEQGIPATFINSSLTEEALSIRKQAIFNQEYKLIYVAPERLNTYLVRTIVSRMHLSLIAIDEAHCISKWGHDFRPSYGEIIDFIYSLPVRPVVAAFTATATPEVTEEIRSLLGLQTPVESNIGFDRPNLTYEVLKVGNKIGYIRDFIKNNYPDDAGIIYCSTRKNVEQLTAQLIKEGFKAAHYHGGMDSAARDKSQSAFLLDQIQIIVATNAFGMGIDKPNVRFVIHYNMPQNMEAYYQEAGRAGRDGEPAHCLLMYNTRDIGLQKYLIESQENLEPDRRSLLYKNLKYLEDYCHTDKCLRSVILRYFGETEIPDHCSNCGNCLDSSPNIDITVEAQKILSCIYRVQQHARNSYGVRMIIAVLRGSKSQKVMDARLDRVSTYGIMSEYKETSLREMVMTLVARGYIAQTVEEYPTLYLTEKARPLLRGEEKIYHKQNRIERPAPKKRHAKEDTFDYDKTLFNELKALRLEIAQEKSLPAFVIFNDATLKEMAARAPTTPTLLLTIKGVGSKKAEQYGEQFIRAIQEYRERAL